MDVLIGPVCTAINTADQLASKTIMDKLLLFIIIFCSMESNRSDSKRLDLITSFSGHEILSTKGP